MAPPVGTVLFQNARGFAGANKVFQFRGGAAKPEGEARKRRNSVFRRKKARKFPRSRARGGASGALRYCGAAVGVH